MSKIGETIDAAKIALVTAALDTKLYVLPRLDSGPEKHVLTVEFHGNDNVSRSDVPP